MSEWVRCAECGRTVGGYVPAGGDGSQVNARPHRGQLNNQLNPYSGYQRCPGGGRAAIPAESEPNG